MRYSRQSRGTGSWVKVYTPELAAMPAAALQALQNRLECKTATQCILIGAVDTYRHQKDLRDADVPTKGKWTTGVIIKALQ